MLFQVAQYFRKVPFFDRKSLILSFLCHFQLVNFIIGADSFQTLTGIVFFLSTFRAVGTFVAGIRKFKFK